MRPTDRAIAVMDNGRVIPIVRCQHWDDNYDESTKCRRVAEPGRAYCREHLGLAWIPPADEPPHPADTHDDAGGMIDPSLRPVDLQPVLDGTAQRPEPTILRRDDRQALLYPGQVNGLHGDSGTGKGWVALTAIAQQITAGRHVLLIDMEDVPESIVARLRQLGCTDDAIRQYLLYVRPTVELGPYAVMFLLELIAEHDVSLVVIDSIGEAFGLAGIDENHDAEVGPWLRAVARVLADAGPAVLLIDHSTKANDNPLHPSGSKRKRAAIGGASYYVTAPTPLSAEHGGRLRLTCAKDRHGTFARGETVADIVLRIDLGMCRWDVYAPTKGDDDPGVIVFHIAQKIVKLCQKHGTGLSKSFIRENVKAKARNTVKDAAIELAVIRGALGETPGPRGSRLFHYVKDLEEM